MKSLIFSIMVCLSIGSLRAGVINGTLFRITSESLLINEIRIDRFAPYQKREMPLTVLRVDYQGTISDVFFFVREGIGVNMLDPATPTTKVKRLAERNVNRYHIYDIICEEQGVFTCGVLIQQKVDETSSPETGEAGVYLAVRGSDPKKLASVLSLILDEIHLGLSGSAFERIGGTEAAGGFEELLNVLKHQ